MKQIKGYLKIVLSKFYFFGGGMRNALKLTHDDYEHLFFGYYDLSPFSNDEKHILIHGKKADTSDIVDILLYHINSKEYRKLGSTTAWNFQQGSRLAWLDNERILYNVYNTESKRYNCIIMNVKSEKYDIVPLPLQALHRTHFMISINYYHLYRSGTEYGYKHPDHEYCTAVRIFFFNSKQIDVLFKVEDCRACIKTKLTGIQNEHLNHFFISPDGLYFIFHYRYYIENKRVDNLFGFSIENRSLDLLIPDEIISHCTWRNNTDFFFWGEIENIKGYYSFDLASKKIDLICSTSYDGHPSFITEDEIITDTYPDKFLRQRLFRLNIKNLKRNIILEHKHPAFYTRDFRCDLHPSLSLSKTLFQIDVLDKKRRKVIIGKL